MESLPIELVRHILQLRAHLICKKVWCAMIGVLNEQYHGQFVWHRNSLRASTSSHWWVLYNYRDLQHLEIPRLFIKMQIYRSDRHSGHQKQSNFLMMHYFYSLRPDFDCKDWFLGFLGQRKY